MRVDATQPHRCVVHGRGAQVWLGALLTGLLVVGCAKPQPRLAPDPPPLDVPPVPPRVLVPLEAAGVEPAEEPVTEPDAEVPAERNRPRSRPAPARAEGAATTAPPTEAAADPPTAEAAPEPLLRRSPTADDAEIQRIREVMNRARFDLERVNYGALSADAKAQFDAARRFIEQAEEALRVKNYEVASYLADKAHTIVRALFG